MADKEKKEKKTLTDMQIAALERNVHISELNTRLSVARITKAEADAKFQKMRLERRDHKAGKSNGRKPVSPSRPI